ncbi:JmjC domain-containing protein, partial [Escherichia coli]|uniref:JmjC domain-containing protein n=1 Tax=Escherichia coli TaxID=562 RepID=UPI003EDEE9B5
DESRLWLSKELECTCSANLYAAFTATPSFGLHFDNHDVIAVQNDGNILMAFIENWIKVNGGWKMQFISYEKI